MPGESERGSRLLPSLPLPLLLLPRSPSSPELISVVLAEFGLLWVMCVGGAGRDAVGQDEGAQGHCRRSSVSDRENAITTSSAPWSMLCCGSWLI